MDLDERLRQSARSLRAKTEGIDVPAARADLARRERRGVGLVALCLLVVAAVIGLCASGSGLGLSGRGEHVVRAGTPPDTVVQRVTANRFRSIGTASLVVAGDSSILGSVPSDDDAVTVAVAAEMQRVLEPGAEIQRGLRIETTIDPASQQQAEAAVRAVVPESSGVVAAVLVADPDTGRVLALLDPAGLVRVPRRHDAALAPLVAAAAIDAGVRPVQALPVPVDGAVAPEDLVPALRRAGISSPLVADEGLLSGRSAVTLWELTSAHTIFSQSGTAHDLSVLSRVVDEDGSAVHDEPPGYRRAVSERAAASVGPGVASDPCCGGATAVGHTGGLVVGVHLASSDKQPVDMTRVPGDWDAGDVFRLVAAT